MDCLFCRIAAGEIPSTKIYEDDKVLAFADIAPKAPVHVLVIPKAHLDSAACVTAENADTVGYIFTVIADICRRNGWESYRVVTNIGADAGQTVHHLHFHILAGRALGEMG